MKLKNLAMITEDKVTEIFCIADDFCKVFDAQMAKYTFKAERKRKYHRESRMSGGQRDRLLSRRKRQKYNLKSDRDTDQSPVPHLGY